MKMEIMMMMLMEISTCVEWRFFASERGDESEGQRDSIDYEKEEEEECV